MTKLEQLIEEYCPNGVTFKTLGELGQFFGGITGKSKDDFIDGNAKFITYKNVYSNPALDIDIEDRVKIAVGEKQHSLQYGDIIFTGSSETPEECGFSSVVTVNTSEELYLNSFCFFFRFYDLSIMLPDFAKHLFRSSNLRKQICKTASGVTRFNVSKKKMESVIIPLPSLPVQSEIVRILDNFTELTAVLTAELTTELTARKQQYEYYKDQLLAFDDDVPTVKLEDVIFSLNTGLNPRQFFKLNTKDAKNYYITIREIRGGKIIPTDKTDRINDNALKLCNNRSNLEAGDILFSGTGTIGETAVVFETPTNWNIKEGVYAIKPNPKYVNSKFLRYLLMTESVKAAYMKKVAGGTVKSIPMGEMRKLELQIPSLEKQSTALMLSVMTSQKVCPQRLKHGKSNMNFTGINY